jgi:hypothetical protein
VILDCCLLAGSVPVKVMVAVLFAVVRQPSRLTKALTATRQNRKGGGGNSDKSLSSSTQRTSLTVSKTMVSLPVTV